MSALKQKIESKTDNELMFYIKNVDKHTDEAVRLALAELKKRSVALPENIDDDLAKELEAKTANEQEKNENSWKRDVVEDSSAPQYYSKNAIYIFSILFSVFFGAFMFASNCKNTDKARWPVILFGFLYSLLSMAVLNRFNANGSITFIANGIGVLFMYELFWARYLGAAVKYRAKPIWKPLAIAAVIFIPLTVLLMYGISQN